MANDIYAFTGYTNVDANFTVNGLNQYLSGPPSTPTYDARGNLTADGYGATGSYDYDNRLISWTPAGGPATALSYDPSGRLYQLQPAGGAGTRFLYDGPNLVGEYNTSNALLRRYVQGPGMDAPLVRYDGTGTSNKRWLLADERGSIIAETSTTGAVVQVNSYDDYGLPASSNVGRFGYTGQLWLAEIGMYSYKNRIYHPGLGRFLQPDPIGLAGAMNLYAYVGGDPINFVDPWGLEREGPTEAQCRENPNREGCPKRDVIVVTGYRTPRFSDVTIWWIRGITRGGGGGGGGEDRSGDGQGNEGDFSEDAESNLDCLFRNAEADGLVGAFLGGAAAIGAGAPIVPKSWMQFLPGPHDGRVGLGGGGPSGSRTSVISAFARGFGGQSRFPSDRPGLMNTRNIAGAAGRIGSRASVWLGVGLEAHTGYRVYRAMEECNE